MKTRCTSSAAKCRTRSDTKPKSQSHSNSTITTTTPPLSLRSAVHNNYNIIAGMTIFTSAIIAFLLAGSVDIAGADSADAVSSRLQVHVRSHFVGNSHLSIGHKDAPPPTSS